MQLVPEMPSTNIFKSVDFTLSDLTTYTHTHTHTHTHKGKTKKVLEAMVIFNTLNVVIVAWVHKYSQTH